jgi:hypothetical protein
MTDVTDGDVRAAICAQLEAVRFERTAVWAAKFQALTDEYGSDVVVRAIEGEGAAPAAPAVPPTFAQQPETLAQADLRPRRAARYVLTRDGAGLPLPARDLAGDLALALAAVDEIRGGDTRDMLGSTLCEYLGAVRRAVAALSAVQDELILIAREPDSDGDVLTWRTLGDAMDGTHLTTVRERHGRLLDGRTHAWRPWLTAGTARAGLYPAGVRKVGDPVPLGACPAAAVSTWQGHSSSTAGRTCARTAARRCPDCPRWSGRSCGQRPPPIRTASPRRTTGYWPAGTVR